MIKTGIKDIPTEYRVAINKKEGFTKFLADLKQIHEEYAQSAVGNPSTHSISQNPEMSTDFSKKSGNFRDRQNRYSVCKKFYRTLQRINRHETLRFC